MEQGAWGAVLEVVRSRILRGWVSDFSGGLGLEFCVVDGVKWRVGGRFFGWSVVWGLGS